MKISHKTILVTGSSKRIGQEIAYYLAKKNAKVVIHYNNSKLDAYGTNTIAIYSFYDLYKSMILPGFTGKSKCLFPVASLIANAAAARGGANVTSPTPLTPNG